MADKLRTLFEDTERMTTSEIYVDKHHISYSPPITQLIPHREHQEIHNNSPVFDELNLKMRQYDKLVQLTTAMKNWIYAYRKEFGEDPIIDISLAEVIKKKILREVKFMVKADLQKVKHIKGLGPRYLAGLLAFAHPSRFRTLHRFLLYCGYKGSVTRYRRKTKSLVYQIVGNLIMKRDSKYYSLYLRIKHKLSQRFPTYRKGRIDRMARNRTGTLLLKEIYFLFRGG